jgi:hypothetical protein
MNRDMTIEPLIDRLLEALESETSQLSCITDLLAELSRLILKRDEAALQTLLDHVRDEVAQRSSNEARRRGCMATIASLLGCDESALTLTMLERYVSPEKARQLQQRKAQLRLKVAELRRQHYSTTLLLTEMIRINRTLLAGITGSRDTMTYGRGGQAKWAGADNILSVRY